MSTPGKQTFSTAASAAGSTTRRMVNAFAAAGSEEMKVSGPPLAMYATGPGTTNIEGDFAPVQVGYLSAREAHLPGAQVYLAAKTVNYFSESVNPDDVLQRWQLPVDNVSYFVGREDLLKQIHTHFSSSASQRLVLSAVAGLGGVGKSQLAVRYVYQVRELPPDVAASAAASAADTSPTTTPYRWRMWFNVENETTLTNDYVKLARDLGLVKQDEQLDAADIVRRVKQFLEKNTGWLAVYDNAGSYSSLKDFIPQQGGHVLVTTRRTEWLRVRQFQGIEIQVFTKDEALIYLHKLTQHRFQSEADILNLKMLAERLGYLPLALAQAGAYIDQTQDPPHAYLKLYKEAGAELHRDTTLPPESEEPLSAKDSALKTVATTWSISLKAIRLEEEKVHDPPLAELVLQAMSYLAPDGIPHALLKHWLIHTSFAPNPTTAQLLLNRTLQRLRVYSMIQLNSSNVSVHNLVQEVIRPTKHELIGLPLTHNLLELFDAQTEILKDEERQNNLLSHLKRIITYIFLPPIVLCQLHYRIGIVLLRQGQIITARDHIEQGQKISEQLLNNEERIINIKVRIFIKLSECDGLLGNLSLAKEFLEKALTIQSQYEQQFGTSDFNLRAETLTRLGNIERSLGNINEAKKHLETVLAFQKQTLPENSLEIAYTSTYLGLIYYRIDEYARAEDLITTALKTVREKYGNEHPEVAIVETHLAAVYYDSEVIKIKVELNEFLDSLIYNATSENCLRAKKLLLESLKVKKIHYGENHPEVAYTLQCLAEVCSSLGESMAINYIKEALNFTKEFYGENHREMAYILGAYGIMYRNLKFFPKAKEYFLKALEILKKEYGGNHIEVASGLLHLGIIYIKLAEIDEAKTSFIQAHTIFNQFDEFSIETKITHYLLDSLKSHSEPHLKRNKI